MMLCEKDTLAVPVLAQGLPRSGQTPAPDAAQPDPAEAPAGARVMVVDDEPENLRVLQAMLRSGRHTVIPCAGGAAALASAAATPPDLILLDIRMPDLDGFEVCRRLKRAPALMDIPVIFLSGVTDIQEKVRAFEAGGTDYVTKPFSVKELLARVRTHLDARYTRLHLDELVRARTLELEAAHRRLRLWDEAKAHWIHRLTHELKTPLTAVFCTAHVLFKKASPNSDLERMRLDFDLSCARINKLIDDAAALATLDTDVMTYANERIPFARFISQARQLAEQHAPDVNFRLDDASAPELARATVPELLTRALCDLLVTASCCTPCAGDVTLAARAAAETLTLEIATCGKGVPADALDTFFDVGGQRALLKSGADYGLGPALSRRIVQLCNGDVAVRNGAGRGLVITMRLPLQQEAAGPTATAPAPRPPGV